MMFFSRTDSSIFGRWWWTVDRWLLGALSIIIVFGLFLVSTASPSVADRINKPETYFIIRQVLYLIPALLIMIGISLLTPRQVLLLSATAFAVGLGALVLTLFHGTSIKGAQRWLYIAGLSVQPSEFVKPVFIVLNGWVLSHPLVRAQGWMRLAPVLLVGTVIALLVLQPDMGMTSLVTLIWMAQLFVAGLPYLYIAILVGMAIFGGICAYLFLPHVTSRIDRFLTPEAGDTYQVDRAMEAFKNGGLFGTGLGQGTMKESIPDSHADFIFAVAGEELGLLLCLVLLGTILFFIMRGLWRAGQGPTLYVTLASTGLVLQFAIQAFVNIGSSLHLIPTKGMTLPFVSYGGSSLLATALGMGMLLALTRKRMHLP